MKGPIKSALSVALAMATSQVFALGLGPIQIKSGLNQPLLAEIPVVTDSAAEADDLRVALASAEDFQRVGLSRARVTVPIEFSVANNGRGQTVIRLTTKDAVREPFLDFLIEASWSKGKLLREYSVLLDPPVTAPAVLATTTPTRAVEKPKPAEAAAPRAPVSQPRAEEAKPVAQAAPAPAPRPAPVVAPSPAPAPASHAGEYTVQRGDTLSQIANEHVDDSRDYNRMLLALYKANPGAFSGNMNALKTGAVLRIPSADEVRAAGSLSEAAAAVRAQNQSWQGGAATVVANAGGTATAEKPSAQAASAKAPASERVALVPPSASGGDTGASRGGSGDGKDTAALRADLAHTKEALSSREQETGELKSRVSQLEDMNNKSQRLISLKDSEIAELQNKLKQLEAAKGGASASAAAATKPETPPAAQAPAPAAPTAAATPPAPASNPVSAPPAPTASTPSTPAPAAAPSPAPAAAATAPTSATTTPVKPSAAAKPSAPASTAKPWYADYLGDNPYALYGVGAILVLIAGWLLSRVFGKKKANPRPALGAAAVAAGDEIGEDAQAQMEKEAEHYYGGEQAGESAHAHSADALVGDDEMEQLRRHFDDGDTDRFVALAHSLHEKLPEDSAEWHEVTELGRRMLPGSPLFAASSSVAHDGHDPDEFFFDHESASKHEAEPETNEYDEQIKAMAEHDEPLGFETSTQAMHAQEEHDAAEFEHELDRHVHAEPAEHDEHEDAIGQRTGLLDEDTVGTRLDLARAYLDMGDPEGARSMLDEVLAEGNETQKDEARKLLAELS